MTRIKPRLSKNVLEGPTMAFDTLEDVNRVPIPKPTDLAEIIAVKIMDGIFVDDTVSVALDHMAAFYHRVKSPNDDYVPPLERIYNGIVDNVRNGLAIHEATLVIKANDSETAVDHAIRAIEEYYSESDSD
jgi:hypothetical protein